MIDTFFIDRFILKNNESYDNENKQNNNTNNNYIIYFIHIFILILSIYLYYDCNKKMNAEIILAIFFPYSYILYNFVLAINNKERFSMKNRCPNSQPPLTNIVTNAKQTIQNGINQITTSKSSVSKQNGGNLSETIEDIINEATTSKTLVPEQSGGNLSETISDFDINIHDIHEMHGGNLDSIQPISDFEASFY